MSTKAEIAIIVPDPALFPKFLVLGRNDFADVLDCGIIVGCVISCEPADLREAGQIGVLYGVRESDLPYHAARTGQ